MKLFRVFGWGLLISFLGSLPLGTLNVAAMQIGLNEGIANAMLFAFGAVIVEMIYVRLSLIGIDWLSKRETFLKVVEWLSIVILLALATGSFLAASKNGQSSKPEWLNLDINRFFLGALGCSINPIVVIFWFGWSTVLFSKKILEAKNAFYYPYIAGIGIGGYAGTCVFIFGGKWLVDKIQSAQGYMNWVIGGIFVLTAIIQVVQIACGKGVVAKMRKHKKQRN